MYPSYSRQAIVSLNLHQFMTLRQPIWWLLSRRGRQNWDDQGEVKWLWTRQDLPNITVPYSPLNLGHGTPSYFVFLGGQLKLFPHRLTGCYPCQAVCWCMFSFFIHSCHRADRCYLLPAVCWCFWWNRETILSLSCSYVLQFWWDFDLNLVIRARTGVETCTLGLGQSSLMT